MYVINFTIFVCGISEECVSACGISTNKKRGSQRSHLGMEPNPPNCWVHCPALPFVAFPIQARLNSKLQGGAKFMSDFFRPPLRAPQGGAIGFQRGAKLLFKEQQMCTQYNISQIFFGLMKHSLDYTDKLLCSTEAKVIKIKVKNRKLHKNRTKKGIFHPLSQS